MSDLDAIVTGVVGAAVVLVGILTLGAGVLFVIRWGSR